MLARRFLVCVLLLGPCLDAAATDSMRCGSRIVSVEARAADVLAACGEPAFRDIHSHPGLAVPGELSDVEQWTYNFGRNRLLHVLRLRNGHLVDIRTDGYGFAPGATPRCDPGVLVDGLSKYRLVASCGQPLTRRTIGHVTTLKPRHRHRLGGISTTHGHYAADVFREEWVYNFGSRHFLKVLTLEDGVVADVRNGAHGSDSR